MSILQMKTGNGPAVCINQSIARGPLSILKATFKKRNIDRKIELYPEVTRMIRCL